MTHPCPACGSTQVVTLNIGRKIRGIKGGAASCAKAGLALGAVGDPAEMALGSLAGYSPKRNWQFRCGSGCWAEPLQAPAGAVDGKNERLKTVQDTEALSSAEENNGARYWSLLWRSIMQSVPAIRYVE